MSALDSPICSPADPNDTDRVDEEDGDETQALVDLIEKLSQSGLQVLFMKEVTFSRQEAIRFFNIIASAPRLS